MIIASGIPMPQDQDVSYSYQIMYRAGPKYIFFLILTTSGSESEHVSASAWPQEPRIALLLVVPVLVYIVFAFPVFD
jgi:hypothetical protein